MTGDWRKYFGSAIIPLLEEFHFGDRTVDLDARYGLAALEKSLTSGECPVTVPLFERPPCGYGCPGCLVCRPQVALTPEGAAAFAATGLVTVTPTTAPGVFTLAATEEDRRRDRRCAHGEGGTENTDQLRDVDDEIRP